MGTTRTFLFERVYVGRIADSTRDNVDRILTSLLEHHASVGAGQEEAVDYVAGMTDRFALRAFEGLVEAPAPPLGVLG
jgi:dGTP triphosphohydrolase